MFVVKSLSQKQKFFLGILLFLGVVLQGITMYRSGLIYEFGMGFWGANGYDGVWHISLANQVLKSFPPPYPTFSGTNLENYHFFFDLLLSLTNKVSGIPIKFLYFQVFPFIFSLCLGLLSFLVGYYWRRDFGLGFWLAFLNYFAGSWGYLVTLARNLSLGGESMFWSMQSISSLINPPFALSLLVILLGMLLLLKIKKWNFLKIVLTGILFGILIQIKSYAAVVALSGLGVFSIVKLLKKERIYFFVFLVSTFIAFSLFLFASRNSTSLFIFEPLWFVQKMIESPDRLYLPQVALARYSLLSEGIGPKLIAIEILGLAIFIVGNLGTRILGLLDFAKRICKHEDLDWFILIGGAVALLIPLFFIQKGTAWNTIQFFYYFLFFANFYFAGFLANLTNKKAKFARLALVLIIVLTIPTTIGSLKQYLGWPPPANIPTGEVEGLNFLAQREDGVVLSFPYKGLNAEIPAPKPLRIYAPTAYVSAFSQKQTFLEETNLDILGFNWKNRKSQIYEFFSTDNFAKATAFLTENKIRYIYLVKDLRIKFEENNFPVKKIFENEEVVIFETKL